MSLKSEIQEHQFNSRALYNLICVSYLSDADIPIPIDSCLLLAFYQLAVSLPRLFIETENAFGLEQIMADYILFTNFYDRLGLKATAKILKLAKLPSLVDFSDRKIFHALTKYYINN